MGPQRLIALLLLPVLVGGCRDEGSPTVDGTITGSTLESGVVDRVNDGDTITLRGGAKVRLVQVDAPELSRDCFGREASRELASLAPVGTKVTLTPDPRLDDRDDYGRRLRYVFVRGTNVNVALVRRGAASPYFFRRQRGQYADELDALGENFELRMEGRTRSARRAHHFSEVTTGSVGLVTDSYGFIALVADRASAADELRLDTGAQLTLVPLGEGPDEAPPAITTPARSTGFSSAWAISSVCVVVTWERAGRRSTR